LPLRPISPDRLNRIGQGAAKRVSTLAARGRSLAALQQRS